MQKGSKSKNFLEGEIHFLWGIHITFKVLTVHITINFIISTNERVVFYFTSITVNKRHTVKIRSLLKKINN